jgi:hypothetical protein
MQFQKNVHAALQSVALVSVLWLLPFASEAYQLTPASISASEGDTVALRVTVEPDDWVVPDDAWVSTCASAGVANATWVTIWKFHFLGVTAEFGDGPTEGDLYLTDSGRRTDDSEKYFACSSGTNPPGSDRNWNQFAVVINEDNLQENTETAKLLLHKVGINAISKIVDQTIITINGDYPFSDWEVSVTGVTPTEMYPGDTIQMTATGERTINPDFSYDGGWAFSFLLSTDADISLADTVIESRSLGEYSSSFSETWTGSLNVQAGTYWLGACSRIADDDPGNDCSEGVEITVNSDNRSPDLLVEAIEVGAETVASGERIEFTADIRNGGDLTAAPSTARIWLSLDEQAGADDFLVDSSATPELDPRMIWRYAGPLPVNADPGDYRLIVCVDAVPEETVLSNNCGLGPMITVSEGTGDGCSAAPLACDSAVSGSLNAEDCTGGPRGEGHYAEKFSYEGTAGDRLFLNANWFGSLDGYLFIEGPDGLTVAQNDNHTGTSNSRIEYELKEDGVFTMWATSLNPAAQGTFELSLSCDAPSGPDLVLDSPATDEGALLPGQAMVVSTRLRNIGDSTSDSTRLRYVLSSNSRIDESDPQLGSSRSGRLSAGSSRMASLELIAPSTPGTYYLGVCADVVSGEASRSNNCSAGARIDVSPQPSCTSRSISCGEYVTGVLSSLDCTAGPRGSGFLTEVLNFNVAGGREFVVNAQWNNFDGYLVLNDPSGAVVAENDDGGSGSRIEYEARQSGVHQLWVTSYDRGDKGSFGIDLRCGSSVAPDLSASRVSVNAGEVSAGQTVTISGTVLNSGNVASGATVANVMLSRDSIITPSDEVLIGVELPSVGSSDSRVVQVSVQAPQVPGNYWLGLCVEPDDGETLTGNNCSVADPSQSSPVSRSTGGRDAPQSHANGNGTLLSVTAGKSCSSSALLCGGSIGGVLNSADCDGGPRGPGYLSDRLTFNAGQGDTVALNARWTGFDGYLYLADPAGNIVAESDDSGGIAGSRMEVVLERSGTYTVWPSAFDQGETGSYEVELECNNPQAPDLAVDEPELSVSSLRAGQSLNIRTQVRNRGGLASEATTVDFILASNPEPGPGDRVLRSNDVLALAGGASSVEAADVAIHAIPGTYYVAACVLQDRQETDTANNCDVAGPITIEATGDPIAINSGMNDAWYNPSTSGQGFFINVFPDNNQVFLSWFTFDTDRPPSNVSYQLGDPGHRWLTAQGRYDLGVAELNVFLTQGGVFDDDQPAATTDSNPYGTITLSFSDCNNGLIEYDLPAANQSGSIAITRVSAENIEACEASLGAPTDGAQNGVEAEDGASNGFRYNSALNEAWFDPATNGQGFFFNIFPDSEFVFLSWFTYDLSRPAPGTPFELGEPGHRWLTAQGPFDGDTASLKVYRTSGGIFNFGSLPAANTVEVGTMTATFDDCNAGLISYDIDSVGRANDIAIRRVAPDTIPACEMKSNAHGAGSSPYVNSAGVTAGVTPSGKPTLENFCNGSVDWTFDWPDVEGAGYYVFELYRNDSGSDSPRVRLTTSASGLVYSGKESAIAEAHLENWRWRYRPVMSPGADSGVSWSKDFSFNVRPAADPCDD